MGECVDFSNLGLLHPQRNGVRNDAKTRSRDQPAQVLSRVIQIGGAFGESADFRLVVNVIRSVSRKNRDTCQPSDLTGPCRQGFRAIWRVRP